MFYQILFIVLSISSSVFSRPQFITLKDGNVGVNFGGYHAEAGLGGLLTGNSQGGGLHASAGTPHGQFAAAGLGGSVDGSGKSLAQGGLYAVAQANDKIKTGAAIQGRVNSGDDVDVESDDGLDKPETTIVKTKQVVKESRVKKPLRQRVITKEIRTRTNAVPQNAVPQNDVNVQHIQYETYPKQRNNAFFDDIFNIPISTLAAVNRFLNNRYQ